MPALPAPALGLRDGDREPLTSWTRASSIRAGLAQRARTVLLAADGVSNTEIAERVGVSRTTVVSWRDRYARGGIADLAEEQRPGRPRLIDHDKIITATLLPPPKKLGVTHWSSRLLGQRLGVANSAVARAWRDYGVQPWRAATFKFSTDPELVAKVTDVVGLYLAPPENATVLCVDEKSQTQALDRTAPILPMQPGLPGKRTHNDVRHGTTTLFAALEIPTGQVTAAVKTRHRHQEFLAFLKQVAKAYPEGDVQLVMDNYAAHKRVEVRTWLAANDRIKVHFTPTSGSWLNRSRCGSGSSNARPSAAAPSVPSRSSTPRSAPSSTAGMSAHTRSSGPRPPTKFSKRPSVQRLRTQTISHVVRRSVRGSGCGVWNIVREAGNPPGRRVQLLSHSGNRPPACPDAHPRRRVAYRGGSVATRTGPRRRGRSIGSIDRARSEMGRCRPTARTRHDASGSFEKTLDFETLAQAASSRSPALMVAISRVRR